MRKIEQFIKSGQANTVSEISFSELMESLTGEKYTPLEPGSFVEKQIENSREPESTEEEILLSARIIERKDSFGIEIGYCLDSDNPVIVFRGGHFYDKHEAAVDTLIALHYIQIGIDFMLDKITAGKKNG